MIRVAVIEDEKRWTDELGNCLALYESETGVGFSVSFFANAEVFLTNYKPQYDIVFMDIKLPGMDGLAAARRLRQYDDNVCLLFTTTMAQFAIKGYEVNALDYFVKPYKYYDLKMRLDRIVKMLGRGGGTYVKIPVVGGVKSVNSDDIYYIESDGHQITYHTTEGNFTVRGEPMKTLETRLEAFGFARCNNSYLVNLRHCREVKGDSVSVGDDVLFLSRGKKKEFLAKFSKFLS